MRSRVLAGALAGLSAGVVFGAMMQLMQAPAEGGGTVPVLRMVAMVVGSGSVVVGWLYHLFNSAVIGASFGLLLGGRVRGYGGGAGWGAAYGLVWWVLGGLVLMPLLLGMPAFAPLRMAPMHGVAAGSLVGHVIYGLLLGGAYVWLARGAGAALITTQRPHKSPAT
jgi:hypothetical protein